jgi:hypothetical protein
LKPLYFSTHIITLSPVFFSFRKLFVLERIDLKITYLNFILKMKEDIFILKTEVGNLAWQTCVACWELYKCE